jgi:hypothetical protein
VGPRWIEVRSRKHWKPPWFLRDKLQERQSIQDEIDDIKARVSSYERAEQELDELDDRLAEIDM